MSNERVTISYQNKFAEMTMDFFGKTTSFYSSTNINVAPSLKLYARSSGCCKTLTSWGLLFA